MTEYRTGVEDNRESAYPIVLADDHTLLRHALKRMLEERGNLAVVGEATDGLDLLRLLKQCCPTLVILDISMPNLHGIEAIDRIKKEHPRVKVLVLTMHENKEYLYSALSSGADGYALKKDAETELFAAIEKIRSGKTYVAPSFLASPAGDWDVVRHGLNRTTLTRREREVLKLICEGRTNRQIGDLLFISINTVQRHRANIMDKLQLKNTADLVRYAISEGYM